MGWLVSIIDTENVIAVLFQKGAGDYFVSRAIETNFVAHPTSRFMDICGKVARERR
jgi:hypothetical protein